jgi:serine protease Do
MEDFLYAVKKYRSLVIANLLVTFVVSLLLIMGLGWYANTGPFSNRTAPADLSRLDLTNQENRVISVVRSANPSVVSIVISKGAGSPEGSQEIGGGTGFFVTPDGLIVTNKHVVDDPTARYTVYAYDGKRYAATVVARDPTQDIAILKINDGRQLPYLKFGDSSRLYLGQSVIAIGNVFDQFKNSVSVGVVSGLSRSIIAGDYSGNLESLDNVIQTDAAINPGNSGGPLLDTGEKVIGVNVAIARGGANIGFALPSNTVRTAVESVLRSGKILRPYLGIRYISVNEIIKDQFDLPYDYGALIVPDQGSGEAGVDPRSPAARAGLVDGDLVLEIDGRKLSDGTTIASIFQSKNAGDLINLKVWHKGAVRELKLKLGEFPIK